MLSVSGLTSSNSQGAVSFDADSEESRTFR